MDGSGLNAYKRDSNLCRHGVHGRRMDLGVDDAEENPEVLTLMQAGLKIRQARDDDGQARVEEVIENYQTLSDEETEQEGAEMNVDNEVGEDDIELGDPEGDPGEQPESDSQQESERRTQGLLFRKGHSADNVWVRYGDQTEFVVDIAHQLSIAPRHILGIHTIDPGPFDRPLDGFSAIVRCVGDQYTDTLECLALVDVFIYTRADAPQEPALFRNVLDLPRLMARRQLLERIGLEPMCVARRNRCLVKIEGQTIPLQHTGPIFAQHGSYIVVRVPPIEPDDLACEEVAMVQTRSTVRTTRTLHLFRIISMYLRVQIRWSDTEDIWLTDRVRELESEIVEDLSTLHEVHTPPRDLELTREPVFLVEGWGDRGRQLCVTDMLVLLDLDIRQSSNPSDNYQLRKVVWMRERITRTSLLTAIRVFQHCIAETYHGCQVFLNHVEIKDETIRHVWNGDFIRIVISGRNRPWDTLCDLQCFEEKDCRNKIFAESSVDNRESYPSSERTGHTHVSDRWCGDQLREDATDKDDKMRREILGDITNTLVADDAPKRTVIDLESALFPEDYETIMAAVYLRIDDKSEILRIEVPKHGDVTDSVKEEIRSFGFGAGDFHRIETSEGEHRFVCFNAADENLACCVTVDGSEEALWFTNVQQLDDGTAMRLLFQSGYTRAFVSNIAKSKNGGWIVSFHKGGFGEMERKSFKHRPAPIFPELGVRSQEKLSDKVRWNPGVAGACRLNTDVNPNVLELFFDSGVGVLRRDFEFLELPIWMEAEMRIAEDTNLAKYHHLKIYVDGSSDPRERLSHPLEAESFGTIDSWAFVVVGVDPEDQEFMIGWSGHTVCYGEDDPHYIGARCMCPASAEREALFWAGLWRLSLNSDISTYFCFDSTTAGNFASGQSGTGELTLQHTLLRGLFQCLETALGADGLAMVHVYGHCGILWNEFVDTAAKYAGRHALYTPRQAIDMTLWRHRIPYLWMIFASDVGLPPLHQDGFRIEPPRLPEVRKHQSVINETSGECSSSRTFTSTLSEYRRRELEKVRHAIAQDSCVTGVERWMDNME